MTIDEAHLATIPGLVRSETVDRDELSATASEMTQAAYTHEQLYGRYCSIQDYINCPPGDVYGYLANVHSLSEWTYSTRAFEQTDEPGLYVGIDTLEADTRIYCRVTANPSALTVDYNCAWDQGDELWMIYLMRVVPAEITLAKPGSVVFWTNCRHPHYDRNPYPEAAPNPERAWVGDYWNLFYAGHTIEMTNLKRILEFRHARGLPVGPYLLSDRGPTT
jgi:hypothetical protein